MTWFERRRKNKLRPTPQGLSDAIHRLRVVLDTLEKAEQQWQHPRFDRAQRRSLVKLYARLAVLPLRAAIKDLEKLYG